MNIIEALAIANAGRRVKGASTGLLTSGTSSFSLEQVQDSYEEVVSTATLNRADFAAAWDAARPSSGSVGAAATSSMFARLCERLGI